MQKIKCSTCKIKFNGRQNRQYCSIVCRRKAELKIRKIKRQIKKQIKKTALTVPFTKEEKAIFDSIPFFDELLKVVKYI